MYINIPISSILFILILQIQSRRFCAWGYNLLHKSTTTDLTLLSTSSSITSTIIDDQILKEYIVNKLYNKSQFRNYHPHYLHSYSYPSPITPHIYFGQVNLMKNFVFLVRDNQTLPNNEAAAQIFFINGKQQYGVKNFLSNQSIFNKNNLQFALIIQIQNTLNKPINTSISVFRFNTFLGVICQLYKDYYKQYIIYISDNGQKPIPLNQLPQDLTIQFKNSTKFNNGNTWRNAYSSNFSQIPSIQLEENNQQPYPFSTFALIIKYNSITSARRYKIAVREFPLPNSPTQNEATIQQYNQIQQIKDDMIEINTNSLPYQFLTKNPLIKQQCEVKAQKQLFQGISYEYGTLILKNGTQKLSNQPKQLFSFTPSRKRYPWGFLWDDGFHCQVAARIQPFIAIKVVKSWLDTMLPFGWIPRQQNRGEQRQYLCNCSYFLPKDIRDANPPTLLLSIDYLSRQNMLTKQTFPLPYYNKLQNWYKWFLATQMTETGSYIFKWHDSLKNNDFGSFNSGMDDFPRLNNSYGHVDCQSWMYFFAKTMSKISQTYNFPTSQYQSDATRIKQQLIKNFIQPQTNLPKDYSIINNHKIYSQYFGYPSILSIALNLIQQNTLIFNSTMKKISSDLDSGYGLTSLSKYNKLYLINQNAYWKGPVWINLNYLFLRGLKLYYPNSMHFYKKLKNDLIQMVCGQQETKGYFYENYINGKGSFSYPFTGWTTLISIIIRQNY